MPLGMLSSKFDFNPCHTEFYWRNIEISKKVYLHFHSFLNNAMVQVTANHPHGNKQRLCLSYTIAADAWWQRDPTCTTYRHMCRFICLYPFRLKTDFFLCLCVFPSCISLCDKAYVFIFRAILGNAIVFCSMIAENIYHLYLFPNYNVSQEK